MRKPTNGVFAAVLDAAKEHRLLSIGTVLCAAASVLATLLPPLLLGRIVDDLTGGLSLSLAAILCYFASLALGGILSSAQETLLEMFGQKMTHALRSEMSRKLTHLPAERSHPGSSEMLIRWKRCLPPVSSAWRRMPAAFSPFS